MTALPMPDVFCKDEVHLIYGLIIAYLTVQFNDELYCNTVILSPFFTYPEVSFPDFWVNEASILTPPTGSDKKLLL